MLWRIAFADASLGWVETGTGYVYTDPGVLVTGALDYSTTDTNPSQPAWYVPTPPPVQPAPPAPNWKITSYAFMQRLTSAERIAIRTVAASSPALYDYIDLLNQATYADLSDPVTGGGVQALETAGLLAPGRAAVVLTTPPTQAELYV